MRGEGMKRLRSTGKLGDLSEAAHVQLLQRGLGQGRVNLGTGENHHLGDTATPPSRLPLGPCFLVVSRVEQQPYAILLTVADLVFLECCHRLA